MREDTAMFRAIGPRSTVIALLALLGVSLAVFWPSWRGELKALGYYPVIVVLNGRLAVVETQPELSLSLAARVSSGKAPSSSILYGSGHTSVLHDGGKPDEGAADFDLEGWVTAEGMVSLTGEVVKSKDPALIGQYISITASEQTGDVILKFGSLILVGNGKVIIR
jgi:hypothetical protein